MSEHRNSADHATEVARRGEDSAEQPRWVSAMRDTPNFAAAEAGNSLTCSMMNAFGEGMNEALASRDSAERIRAEDEILASTLSSTVVYKQIVEAKMSVLAGGKNDPEMETFAKLAAVRERLEHQIESVIRLRRTLSGPGALNLRVSGNGPQQFNIKVPPQRGATD